MRTTVQCSGTEANQKKEVGSFQMWNQRTQLVSAPHADWTRTCCPTHYMTEQPCGSWCEPVRLAFIQAAEALDAYWRRKAVALEYERRYGARVA